MVDINCDMGESFGLYAMGDDEGIMPYVTEANIACGFHASDPNHMRKTVERAKAHKVKIGAHFSLPDLQGFGRREMKIGKDELINIIIYQIGALKGFLDILDVELCHLKPHGALYGMAARQEDTAEAVVEVAQYFKVPLLGITNTLHESVCKQYGVDFKAEFFADLDYNDQGGLIITREHDAVEPEVAAERCIKAVQQGKATSINGVELKVKAETICIHSDTPNAVSVAKAVHASLSHL